MRDFIFVTKALADPNRVRMLLALEGGELCVCQMVELLGLAPSTVSKHLAILNHAGLVRSRKSERWVYYKLPGDGAPAVARQAIEWVHTSLAESTEAIEDRARLREILKLSRETLCQRQAQG